MYVCIYVSLRGQSKVLEKYKILYVGKKYFTDFWKGANTKKYIFGSVVNLASIFIDPWNAATSVW